MRITKKTVKYAGISVLLFFIFNAIKIYRYSFEYVEQKSDVAIVLGAGTNNGELSPVFKERVNHSIYLYRNGRVDRIIFTGGKGKNQVVSDSEVAKEYAINEGVPFGDILIEEKSNYTYENLFEAKILMDSFNWSSALVVSDPIHM